MVLYPSPRNTLGESVVTQHFPINNNKSHYYSYCVLTVEVDSEEGGREEKERKGREREKEETKRERGDKERKRKEIEKKKRKRTRGEKERRNKTQRKLEKPILY